MEEFVFKGDVFQRVINPYFNKIGVEEKRNGDVSLMTIGEDYLTVQRMKNKVLVSADVHDEEIIKHLEKYKEKN